MVVWEPVPELDLWIMYTGSGGLASITIKEARYNFYAVNTTETAWISGYGFAWVGECSAPVVSLHGSVINDRGLLPS